MGAKVGRWFLGVGPARAFPSGEASSRPRESGVPLADIKKFEEITGRDKCNLVLQPFWKTDSEEVADEIADFINVRYKDVFQAGGGISQLPLIIHIIGSEGTPPASRAWLDHAVDEASRANPKSMQGVLYALAKDADARIRAILSEGANRRTTHAPADGGEALRADGLDRDAVLCAVKAFRRAAWEYQDSREWVERLSVTGPGVEEDSERGQREMLRGSCGSRNTQALQDVVATCPVILRAAEHFGMDIVSLKAAIARNPWNSEIMADLERVVNDVERRAQAMPDGGLGWTFHDLPDHQTRAYHEQLCEQYADLDSFDLLELCGKWRALAKSFTKDACASGRHGAHVVHDPKVDSVTRLLETACADRGLSNTDRLGRSLRRPDNDHLHYALALLDDLEARLRAEAVAKGIRTVAAKPANRANGETGPAAMNPIHSHLSASTKDQDDSLIAGYARATAGDLLADCNRMIQCLAGFDTVFLMSPKGASEQASQIDDEWFKGFNRTHETLCLAASARKMDVAPYKRLTNCAYAFWKGAADPKSTETEWKLLFPPGIEVLHNLKRAMMVEMAKADTESQAAFAKGARILDRAHRERCFKEIDAAVKRGDVSAALNIFADDVAPLRRAFEGCRLRFDGCWGFRSFASKNVQRQRWIADAPRLWQRLHRNRSSVCHVGGSSRSRASDAVCAASQRTERSNAGPAAQG
jgi:hypothetical protein